MCAPCAAPAGWLSTVSNGLPWADWQVCTPHRWLADCDCRVQTRAGTATKRGLLYSSRHLHYNEKFIQTHIQGWIKINLKENNRNTRFQRISLQCNRDRHRAACMHFSAQKHGQTLCLGPCFWLASLGRRVHLSVVCLWDSVSEFRLLPFCSAKVPTENSQQATATANCLLPASAVFLFAIGRSSSWLGETIYVDAYRDSQRPLEPIPPAPWNEHCSLSPIQKFNGRAFVSQKRKREAEKNQATKLL